MKVCSVWPMEHASLPLTITSVGCALAGLAAWIGYARNSGRAIQAVVVAMPAEAHRLTVLAGWYSLAQIVLGFLAVGLALYERRRRNSPGLARWTSAVGLCLGIGVLLLMLLLV